MDNLVAKYRERRRRAASRELVIGRGGKKVAIGERGGRGGAGNGSSRRKRCRGGSRQ